MNDIIIALAKASIFVAVGQSDTFDLENTLKTYPALEKKGAVFVTITTKETGRLRGCIGSLEAYRPLYQDIIRNARAAALDDPRFKPLQPDELSHINIEVSVLNDPQPLPYANTNELKKRIRPYIDGVVLQSHGHRATYLPSVWEELPNFNDFFASLCLKANLDKNCLNDHPEIRTYQVVKYKDTNDR